MLCSYLPFGFVSMKFAPETVEADVRLGTDVWIRLPRVVMVPASLAATARGSTAPPVSNAVLCLPGAAAAAQDVGWRSSMYVLSGVSLRRWPGGAARWPLHVALMRGF